MEDKRSEPRVAHQMRFLVAVDEATNKPELVGESLDCEAIDFSMHGTQFQTDAPLSRQDRVTIVVSLGEEQYQLRGEVRWVRKAGGDYFVGTLLLDEKGTDYGAWADNFAETFSG
ncbi:MAG: PilZ domain-containing protein [Pseudomonadales bacterium]|nr:PilZ domain-containing protein [Pseudomonadales bacterium]